MWSVGRDQSTATNQVYQRATTAGLEQFPQSAIVGLRLIVVVSTVVPDISAQTDQVASCVVERWSIRIPKGWPGKIS